MLNIALVTAIGTFTVALVLNLWRLAVGPTPIDRVLALDTLYVNAIALLLVLGIAWRDAIHFEAALLIAMLGFAGTCALARYLLRGRIIG
jgi:multicomponent K+:H+ antiporter subunit F